MIETSLPILQCPAELAADEALAKRVELFLQTRQIATGQPIEIEARAGVVTLDGAVRSFYERQVTISCARHVAGVRHVVDLLRVPDGRCTCH